MNWVVSMNKCVGPVPPQWSKKMPMTLRQVFGPWPYSLTLRDDQREAVFSAIIKEELPPLNDTLIKELVKAASKGGAISRAGNASARIVQAVERYHGVAGEAMCPLCGKSIASPPCSMNSDGAFHLSHPHNPARTQPRLFGKATAPGGSALGHVHVRRLEQDARWGGPEHDDAHDVSDWLLFINKQKEQALEAEDDATYRDRLLDIAALAVAAIESLDRKMSHG